MIDNRIIEAENARHAADLDSDFAALGERLSGAVWTLKPW